jgi:hypothetical protein
LALTFKASTFEEIERLRTQLDKACTSASDVETAASQVAQLFLRASPTCVLARLFMVLPLRRLPTAERTWAETFATKIGRTEPLAPTTQVLSLLGTAGLDAAWNVRTSSAGHRAIPLIDRAFVEGAPMIAALLGSFKLDLGTLNHGEIALRTLQGGLNARFFVEDAQSQVDSEGRFVIGAREFVAKHQVRSVFGMGGSYVGGELAVAILFTKEPLRATEVDRFSSLISSFKMATSAQVAANRIYAAS